MFVDVGTAELSLTSGGQCPTILDQSFANPILHTTRDDIGQAGAASTLVGADPGVPAGGRSGGS